MLHARVRRGLLAALASLLPVTAASADPGPFWRSLAGSWTAEASYVDARMQPIVARYAVQMRVELDGDAVVITEWKFYPDGALAQAMAGGRLASGRGLETVTRSVGRPAADDPTVLDFGAERGRWTATTPELAAGVVPGSADAPRYRFVAALSGPRHATLATYGYAEDGSLKGLALFRMQRLGADRESAGLEALRREYAVGLTLDSRQPPPRS